MTDYKPLWTEQSTTTMNTTNPSEIKKTSDDFTLIMLSIVVMFLIVFIGLTADNYYKGEKEIEFVKAGLVQKVEEGRVIWTKP